MLQKSTAKSGGKTLETHILRKKKIANTSKSGQAQKAKKKWKYFDIMGFLAETVVGEETVSSFDYTSSETQFAEAMEHPVLFGEEEEQHVVQCTDDSTLSNTSAHLSSLQSSSTRKKHKNIHVPEVQEIIEQVSSVKEDEDSVFCESLALSLKKLPNKIRRQTKVKLLNVMMEAENEADSLS